MKLVILLLSIFGVLLSSCGVPYNDSEFIETNNPIHDQAVVSIEPYSFSEINTIFGPAAFSANELATIFGNPNFISGYYSEKNGEDGFFVLSVKFEDIIFDLAANNGEELNFIYKVDSIFDSVEYEVADSDKDVKMKPRSTGIFCEDWELPRSIKLGDSVNAIYNAYDGNKGKGRFAQGQFMVSYDYGESGRVTYMFSSDHIEDINCKLSQVFIEWYDANNYPDYSGLPPS